MTPEELKEEDFIATVKLVSGEEIVARVCYLPDEDKVILENPLQVEQAKTRKGDLEISGFSFKEWMSATFDQMFIVNRDHIITMSELGAPIIDFYEKTMKRLENGKSLTGRGNKLPRTSGYLGSINQTKKNLEDIFKKS
tara:strand:+ start:3746 stop:4162 length:417 start_codon:yes stop_codon:yes gene_type:complete